MLTVCCVLLCVAVGCLSYVVIRIQRRLNLLADMASAVLGRDQYAGS